MQAVSAQCTVVDHLADTPERERYVDALVKARAKKGLKPEAARELLEDGNYYGTMMTLCATAHSMKTSGAQQRAQCGVHCLSAA